MKISKGFSPGATSAALTVGTILAAGICLFAIDIALGSKNLPLLTVWEALLQRDPGNFSHTIVWDLRLPRAIVAVLVGASLSVAGAIMQGVLRNPLADPGLLGLMAGSSFAVIAGIALFGLNQTSAIPWLSALGASGAAASIYLIARTVPGGPSPLTLTLIGAMVTAFLGAMTSTGYLLQESAFETMRAWLTGSVATRDFSLLVIVAPILGLAILFSLLHSRHITALSMNDETARALGVRMIWIQARLLLAVIVLTAGSVALAGPLGFVGLVVPHAVRFFCGASYTRILPFSAAVGAIYLLAVDIAGRTLFQPYEITAGIVSALIGSPIFIYLIRKRLI